MLVDIFVRPPNAQAKARPYEMVKLIYILFTCRKLHTLTADGLTCLLLRKLNHGATDR